MIDKFYNNAYFKPDYIRDNPIVITIKSVDGKFADLTKINLVRGSIKLKQALCSESYFIWGGFNASQLSFECWSEELQDTAPEGKIQLILTPTVYKSGVISERLDNEAVTLFTGYIEKAEPSKTAGNWSVTAYDRLYRVRNNNIADWLSNHLAALKEMGKRMTWHDMITQVAVQLGCIIYEELPAWTNNIWLPDNDTFSNENGVDLLREFALCMQRFGMLDGEGKLHFIEVQDSKTGSECYCIDLWDPSKFSYSVGHVWLPKFFVSEPRTNIFYTTGETTTEEDYYNNYYTIKNSAILGNQDWINERYGCDEYGKPNAAYSASNMPAGLFDTNKMCLTNGEEYYCQEYSIKTWADPTIPMGSILHIRKHGNVILRSYIMQRTITIKSQQVIQCEYSASNAPYNSVVSELDYGVRSANAKANEISAKMPFISDGSSLNKLRACKVISKDDYNKLSEKRDDTIYYVYDTGGDNS